ncbi:MAG: hypothetical protein ABI208_06615 [Ginsengibacter sp.]|jgi:hypothetical protein
MEKQIIFQVEDENLLNEKIIHFFTQTGFKLVDSNNYKLKFSHSSSIFDNWKTNPLKWGSKIIVSLNDKDVSATFLVDSGSQMNSIEEENTWDGFIANFEGYLTGKAEINSPKKDFLAEVKSSRLNYIGWAILGAFVGVLVGLIFYNLTENKTIGYLSIPIMASLFLTNRINFKKEKALQNQKV